MLEDLKSGNQEYEIVEEFLTDLKKKFRERDEEAIKLAELKKLEQGSKTIKEFI